MAAVPPLNFTDAGMSTATVGPATVGGLTIGKKPDWFVLLSVAGMAVAVALILGNPRK